MDFSKIGITKNGAVEIHYEGSKSYTDTIKRHCEDSPLPSFDNALQALVEDVVNQCDLKPEDALNGSIIVRHVTLKWNEQKGEGVSITAEKTLPNGKSFGFPTPLLYQDGKKASLPESCALLIEKVKNEAMKYVNGERLQGELKI